MKNLTSQFEIAYSHAVRTILLKLSMVVLVCAYVIALAMSGLGYGIPTAEAAIPKNINFQGKLTQVSNGNNVANGSYSFEFKLYAASSGGVALWTETWDGAPAECPQLPVTNGVFNAKLGSCEPFTNVDFTTGSLYLTVNFNPGAGFDGEMTPRKQLVSSAYAFVANGVSGDGVVNNAIQSATALTTGRTTANPALQVDTNTASSATGLKVTAAAAGGGLALAAISSGANENLTLDAKGSGTISLGATSTGNLILGGATGDILLGGGSAFTGCTVTNATGALACTAGGSFTTLGLAGAISGATGLTSSGTIQFSSLTSNGALYTSGGNGTLTTTAPTSGALGYWTRSGTTLSPATSNDIISASGNSGDILTLASSATGSANKTLNVSQTGATSGTDYAGHFSNTGAATTNVGLYATATGATNNYAAIFEAGNVGIGDTTPASLFTVGSGDLFQINSTGQIGSQQAPVSDYLFSLAGTTGNDNSRIIDITQDNNTVGETTVAINTVNTANLGAMDSSIGSIHNMYASLIPTATLLASSDTGTLGIYGNQQEISLATVTLGNSATNGYDLDTYGNYSGIIFNPIINNTNGSALSPTAEASGTYSNISGAPTYTNVNFTTTINTHAGRFDNQATSTGNANINYTAYGVYGSASGNLTTTGTTAHYGGYFTAAGTADNNYGIYTTVTAGTNRYAAIFDAGDVGIGITAPTSKLHVVAPGQTLVSAASAEYTSGTFTAPTITFTGTTQVISQMDSFLFNQPTFAGTAATVDNAATMTIAGAPIESGSVVLTNTYGLKIDTGAVGAAVASYGLHVSAQTGAASNYGAVFSTGNVGIGDTSPTALLTVGANDAFQVNSSGNIAQVGAAAHTIANSSGALSIDAATSGALNLNNTGTGNILFGNGSGSTGCTLTNSTGAYACSSTIASGVAGSTIGGFLLSGNTSGTISILPQAAAGTYNYNLPTTAGTSGHVLTSGGGGSTAMTWTDPSELGIRWNSITAPNGNLSLAHGANTTAFTFNSFTAGTAFDLSSTTMTAGNLLRLASTSNSVTSNTQTLLNIDNSGANAFSSQTTYGAQISNTHTGTSATNVALYLNASGAPTIGASIPVNYALRTNAGVLELPGDTRYGLVKAYASADFFGLEQVSAVQAGYSLGAATRLFTAGGSSAVIALGKYTNTTAGSEAFSTFMLINNSGNVGIGDVSPGALFTVGNGDLFQVDSSGRVFAPNGASGAGNLSYSFVNDTDTGLYRSATNELRVQTNGGDRVTIDANGNVGIGATAPGTSLDIDIADATGIVAEKSGFRLQNTAQTLPEGTTIANWRAAQFLAPTINGVAAGLTEIVTTAATLYVDGAPSGSNITFTNGPYALWVDAGASRFDGDVIVGGSTSFTENLNNVGFSLGGDDLYVAGSAGIDGNVYTDGSFIAGASTTISNGLISQSSGETLTIGTTSANVTLQTITSGNIALNSAGTIELQDATNVTGALDVSTTLAVGTADAFAVNASGAITAATGITSTGTIAFTNATIANAAKLLAITGTATTSTSSGTGYGFHNTFTNANTTNADTAYANFTTVADATALANTVYGNYTTIALSGNAAKTGVGQYATISTSSTTADTIIGADIATTTTGIITTGTRNVYGERIQPASTAASTGGTTNVYGSYVKAGGTVAAGGTLNGYGLYIANGTYNTTGTSQNIGLYVETPTGADVNYAAVFAGGNVGIGDTTPAGLLTVGTNDALTINSSGNLNTSGSVIASNVTGSTSVTTPLLYTNTIDAQSNPLVVTGGPIHVADGTVSDPTYAFGSNPATGIYLPDNRVIGFSAHGTLTMAITEQHAYIPDGSFCVGSSGNCQTTVYNRGEIHADNTTVLAVDLAENYPSKDTTLLPGELVMIDAAYPEYIMRDNLITSSKVIGVVSTKPGITLGKGQDYGADTQYPIALAGRVPVKVTNENGAILPGDFLTASNTTPGAAMRATKAGPVIGQALEGYVGSTESGVRGPVVTTSAISVFIKPTNFNGMAIEDQMEGVAFDYSDPEEAAETSVEILDHLLDQLPDLDSNNLSQLNTDIVIAGAEVITPNVTTKYLRTDFLSAATENGSLTIASNVIFEGGLQVDSVSSISGLLAFQDDVEFFGTPYFTKDTAGFAVVQTGAQSVDVKFTREYLTQPIVNASISLEQDADQSGLSEAARNALRDTAVADAQVFLTDGISYVITNKSKFGFTIVLSKPAIRDTKLSWTALAVRSATTFMSLEAAPANPPADAPDLAAAPTVPTPPDPTTPPEEGDQGNVAGDTDTTINPRGDLPPDTTPPSGDAS